MMNGLKGNGSVPGVVRAAVVQAAPVAFDVDATLAKAKRLTAESAFGGAELVVFPEAFVSCYPRGLTFGATVGSRTPEGRGGDRVTLVPRLIGRTEAARRTKGAGLSRPRRRWTEAELLEAIRERNQPELVARMIGLYEWMKGEGARASGGTGATTPSVSLWLGEDADPGRSNPVSVQIFPDSITIPFGLPRVQRHHFGSPSVAVATRCCRRADRSPAG